MTRSTFILQFDQDTYNTKLEEGAEITVRWRWKKSTKSSCDKNNETMVYEIEERLRVQLHRMRVVKAIGCLSQILSFDSIPIRSRASKDIRFSTRQFLVLKMEISKSQLVFSPPPESPHKPPCYQTSYDGFVSRSSLPFLRLHLHTRWPFSGSDCVDFHSTEPWLLTGFYNIYNRETGRSKHLKSQCVVSNSSRTQE